MEILFVSTEKEVRDEIGSFLEQQGNIVRFVGVDQVSYCLDRGLYSLVIIDGSSDADLALSICGMIQQAAQASETFLLMLAVEDEGKEPSSWLEAGANDIWILPMSSRLHGLRWAILKKCLIERQRWMQQEERLQAMKLAVESMQLGVTVTDQAGRILYTNPAEAEMHGYSVEELFGRDASYFGQPGIRRSVNLDEMRAMGSWKRESVNIRKDGSSFPVQLISDVVRSSFGKPIGIVTTCEDITPRKKREEELRQSENRFRMVAEEAPVMLWMNLNNEELFTHRWLNLTGRTFGIRIPRSGCLQRKSASRAWVFP